MTQRYCKTCGGWHDLDEPWPHAQYQQPSGIQIIKDIDPYKAVAVDVATGKRPVIAGRRQHKEFLKRNGYVEVGNEKMTPRKPELDTVSKAEIKRVMDEIRRR